MPDRAHHQKHHGKDNEQKQGQEPRRILQNFDGRNILQRIPQGGQGNAAGLLRAPLHPPIKKSDHRAKNGGRLIGKIFIGVAMRVDEPNGLYKFYNEDGSFYGIAEVLDGVAKLKTKLC